MKTYKIRINNTEYIKSQEEILEMNLSPDTLVWSKGFINWMKLKDVTELNPVTNDKPSTKIVQLLQRLKPQKKITRKKEGDTAIATIAESVEDTDRSNAPSLTNEGIILGDPTPKQTKKKLIWVVIFFITVILVYALFSYNNNGLDSNLFDACDIDSICEDTCIYSEWVDSCCADTFVAE